MIYSANTDGSLLATSNVDVCNGDLRLPTGRILLGETPIEAVVRVLREQTGYVIANRNDIHIVFQPISTDELTLVYSVDSRCLAGSKITGAIWVSTRRLFSGAFNKINQEVLNNL
jgi:8-oxo-dGTP pyrophosphatase MutT (NUDIX family)